VIAWKSLTGPDAKRIMAALERVLLSWAGTRYMISQQEKGVGVDCVRFVCGVLDELRGTKTPIDTLPQDAAMHARASAVNAMRQIVGLFKPNKLLAPGEPDWYAEPGDLVITSPPGGGPGHAMIVGGQPHVLWESSGSGVRKIGLGTLLLPKSPWKVAYVYRPLNKAEWK
jgi:cell wall-associated NlpC family hydrolase